jgi:nucleoside-triphosphatase THEP1
MECFSAMFRQTLLRVLDSPNTVVGSIALKGDAFANAIKKRLDTRLIPVSEKNRDVLAEEVLSSAKQGVTNQMAAGSEKGEPSLGHL